MAWLAAGYKPYSVRIDSPGMPPVWQSYSRAEPLSFIIGSIADAVEISKFQDIDPEKGPDEQTKAMWGSIIAGISQNTMSKSFLTGLSDFTNMMSDPQRYFDHWWKSLASAQIPFSALRRDLTKIQDPLIREAWTAADKIKATSGIPGISENAPLKLDPYGDPITYDEGAYLGVMSPYPDKSMSIDPIKLKIADLMVNTNKVAISRPTKFIDGVKLTAQEYHDYLELSRKKSKIQINGVGRNFMGALKWLMNSRVQFEGKNVKFTDLPPDLQVEKIRDIQRDFDTLARYTMLSDKKYKDLQERHTRRQIEHTRRLYGDQAAQQMERALQ